MKALRRLLLLGGLAGLTASPCPVARADEKGDRILREAFRNLHQAQTMTAELTVEATVTGRPTTLQKGTVTLKKPNFINVALSGPAGSQTRKVTYVSDGTNYYTYMEGAKNYMRQPAEKNATEFTGNWEGEVDAFFGGEKIADKVNAELAGTETLDGVPCDLIRATMKQSGDNRVLMYAIGQRDRLVYRDSWSAKLDEKITVTQTNRLRNIRLNGPVAAAAFAFSPPKDVALFDPAAEMRAMEQKLVPVGEEAPAFELSDPKSNSRFSLAKMLDGRKAVLVNFWFYN